MIQFYFIDSVNKLRTYALRSILSGLLQNGVVQIGHSIGYAPAGCNIITIAFANLRQPHLMYSITAISKGQMWRRKKNVEPQIASHFLSRSECIAIRYVASVIFPNEHPVRQ